MSTRPLSTSSNAYRATLSETRLTDGHKRAPTRSKDTRKYPRPQTARKEYLPLGPVFQPHQHCKLHSCARRRHQLGWARQAKIHYDPILAYLLGEKKNDYKRRHRLTRAVHKQTPSRMASAANICLPRSRTFIGL